MAYLNMPAAPLPDLDTLDAAALKSLILKQHEEIASHAAEVERLRLLIARLQHLRSAGNRRRSSGRLNSSNCNWRIWRLATRRNGNEKRASFLQRRRPSLLLQAASRRAVLCRIIFHARSRCPKRKTTVVQHAVRH